MRIIDKSYNYTGYTIPVSILLHMIFLIQISHALRYFDTNGSDIMMHNAKIVAHDVLNQHTRYALEANSVNESTSPGIKSIVVSNSNMQQNRYTMKLSSHVAKFIKATIPTKDRVNLVISINASGKIINHSSYPSDEDIKAWAQNIVSAANPVPKPPKSPSNLTAQIYSIEINFL